MIIKARFCTLGVLGGLLLASTAFAAEGEPFDNSGSSGEAQTEHGMNNSISLLGNSATPIPRAAASVSVVVISSH